MATGGGAGTGARVQLPAACAQGTRWTCVVSHGSVPAQEGRAPAATPSDKHMPGHADASNVPAEALKVMMLAQLHCLLPITFACVPAVHVSCDAVVWAGWVRVVRRRGAAATRARGGARQHARSPR